MDIWNIIREERLALADTLETLEDDEWERPSLCTEWTVRQVLGHLVINADPPFGKLILATVRALGRFRIANSRLAVEQAKLPPSDLIALFRSKAASRAPTGGLGPAAPLNDILMHSLDIRVPLGIDESRPPERYAPAIEIMLRNLPIAFFPRGRPSVRWVASDHEWARGSGPEVRGRMADLLLAVGGRGARLDALEGPGHALVVAWCDRRGDSVRTM